MAAREIVISLRLTEGTTREQFRALKAALIDVKTEIRDNNKALAENKAKQDALTTSVNAAGVATEAQVAQERVLSEQRKQLKQVAADLALSEAALGTQYKTVQRDLLGAASTTDKLRQAQVEQANATVKQRDAINAATEKAKQLSVAAKNLFAEFKKGDRTDEQFHRLNAAILDTRAALKANNRELDLNAKAEAELTQEIRLQGAATEEQASTLQHLQSERGELQAINSSLKISEGQLSAALRETGNDVKGLTEASLRFRDKMAQASKEALEQSGILGQLGARMEFLRSEQDRLNKELLEGKGDSEQLRAALDKLSNEEREVASQTTALNGRVDLLTKEFKEGRISVDKYRADMAGLNASVQGVGTAVNKGVADLKAYALGFVGVVAVAQGAVNVIKNVGKTIVGFQQANANLAAILGTTRDRITELTDSAIKIGPAFARAPEEVTQLQTELAKLGFTVHEIVAAQEAVITLANATGETLAKSAEVAAATLNGFNLTAEQTGRVVDVIAQAANASSLDLEKFSVAMATVAPAANQAGFSIEETTALIGVLSDRGLDASTAGTALRSMFIDLAKTGQTFEQAMAEINASTNKTGTAFKLFGERAAGAAVILAEAGDETDRLTDALNNAGGAAGKVASEQLNTLSGSIDKLSSSWDGFILSLDKGDGVISDTISGILDTLSGALGLLSGNLERAEVSFARVGTKAALAGEQQKIGVGIVDALGKAYEAAAKHAEKYETVQGLTTTSIKELEEESGRLTARLNALGFTADEERLALQRQIAALSGVIDARKKYQDVLDKGSASQEKSAEAVQKEVDAIAQAAETVGGERKKLNDQLKQAKQDRDALTKSDAKGRAEAEAEILSIQAQIEALDGKKAKEKELTEAEKEKIDITKALTKAEEDRARAQRIDAQTKVQQQADPTIPLPQAKAEAAAIVDSTERLEKVKGDAELERRIAEQLAADLLAIRTKGAQDQISAQDRFSADLRSRNAALAQDELNALIERQNAELVAAAKNGDDINALAERQAQERIALTKQIEDAAIAAKLESFDVEYAQAVQNGDNLLALTETQQAELAALKASFRADEVLKQQEANQLLLDGEQALLESKAAAAGALFDITSSFIDQGIRKQEQQLAADRDAGRITQEQYESRSKAIAESAEKAKKTKALLVSFEKAAAVTQIIIQTSAAKQAALAQAIITAGPIAGPLIAAPAITALEVQAGINIAKIIAQAIAGFDKGGTVGSGNGTIKRSWGRPIRRKNGDDVLITAKEGEKILNEDQQEELERQHGKDVWRRIGLPGEKRVQRTAKDIIQGFASGGSVSSIPVKKQRNPGITATELTNIENNVNLSTAIDNIEFMVSVQEINKVQQRVAQVTELSRG